MGIEPEVGEAGTPAIDAMAGALAGLDEMNGQMRRILDAMPHMVWSTTAAGDVDFYNEEWYRVTGAARGSTDGIGWTDVLHPDDQSIAWERWSRSIATGHHYEVEYRLRRHDGQYQWHLARARPIRSDDGTIERWIGTCTDIHELKEAEADLALVAGELTHRIKNMFAVASAMLTLGARKRGAEAREFAAATAARLDALGRSQDLIRPGRTAAELLRGGSSLHALIATLSAPHVGGRFGTLEVGGTDIEVSADRTTPIVLVLHELFTNALKYGALSTSEGRLAIDTVVRDEHLVMQWTESGGPVLTGPPQRQGFGSSLSEKIVRQQLSGNLEMDWRPEGLAAILTLPIGRLRN